MISSDNKHSHKPEIRKQLIIDVWRNSTGKNSIPSTTQYWTLGGQCDYQDSEYHQLVSSKLIKPRQFNSVDMSRSVVESGRRNCPRAHFHHGRMFEVMESHKALNPAIIHYDTQSTIDTAKGWFEAVLEHPNTDNCLFIFNTILVHQGFGINLPFDYMASIFEPLINDDFYKFQYTGENGIIMAGAIYYKK